MKNHNNISLQLIREGDRKTFERVFRLYYRDLVLYSNRFLEDMDAAEEVVQEIFCKLWERREQLDINTSIKSYLFAAVRNSSYNLIKHIEIKYQYKYYIDQQIKLEEQSLDGDELLIKEELEEKILVGMDKLPERCKEVFCLNRQEGLKYREISDQLSISVKTVENQMGKALKFLRNELKDYLPLFIALWSKFF